MQVPLRESPPHIPLAALRPIALHKGPVDTSVPPTTSYLAEPASPLRNSGVLLTRTETPEGVGSALPCDVPGGCQNIAREHRRSRQLFDPPYNGPVEEFYIEVGDAASDVPAVGEDRKASVKSEDVKPEPPAQTRRHRSPEKPVESPAAPLPAPVGPILVDPPAVTPFQQNTVLPTTDQIEAVKIAYDLLQKPRDRAGAFGYVPSDAEWVGRDERRICASCGRYPECIEPPAERRMLPVVLPCRDTLDYLCNVCVVGGEYANAPSAYCDHCGTLHYAADLHAYTEDIYHEVYFVASKGPRTLKGPKKLVPANSNRRVVDQRSLACSDCILSVQFKSPYLDSYEVFGLTRPDERLPPHIPDPDITANLFHRVRTLLLLCRDGLYTKDIIHFLGVRSDVVRRVLKILYSLGELILLGAKPFSAYRLRTDYGTPGRPTYLPTPEFRYSEFLLQRWREAEAEGTIPGEPCTPLPLKDGRVDTPWLIRYPESEDETSYADDHHTYKSKMQLTDAKWGPEPSDYVPQMKAEENLDGEVAPDRAQTRKRRASRGTRKSRSKKARVARGMFVLPF